MSLSNDAHNRRKRKRKRRGTMGERKSWEGSEWRGREEGGGVCVSKRGREI